MPYHQKDILIIGAGTAGLTAALKLANQLSVAVICKSLLGDGASLYAQGGIAAVIDKKDSLEAHIRDTLIAGDGLCKKNVVEFTVRRAKRCIQWLIDRGIDFTFDDQDKSQFHLTIEGGHSHRRILHSADSTGQEIQGTLSNLIRQHKNITVYQNYHSIDVILKKNKCVGIYALNTKNSKIEIFTSQAVILATGGASWVYQNCSSPVVSSGDGIAMAYRAGCRVANLEFNQFHPTCLYNSKAGSFLLSEALRGEGAYLCLENGHRFMKKIDNRAELAPRDIVARAIDLQMKKYSLNHVYLDMTHKSKYFIKNRFPMLYNKLHKLGLDLTSDLIPVIPAAHYTCGGVIVDHTARTNIPGLYGVGEMTCTGLHGANRMASNSLLECLVYAFAASEDILYQSKKFKLQDNLPRWNNTSVNNPDEKILIRHNCNEVRRCMWDFMGIVRTNKRLERAMNRITLLRQEILHYYNDFTITTELLELKNLLLVSELMVTSAMKRKESRGVHYTLDYQKKNNQLLKSTILDPKIKGL